MSAEGLRVGELWRYPVKSMYGERLSRTRVEAGGVPGDRLVHVRDHRGLVTGRSAGALLSMRGATGTDGRPTVAGHPWDGDAAATLVRQAAGETAQLAPWDGPERFDVLPLLVSTDAEVRRWGYDGRRLRPNLVVDGARPRQERDWPGKALRIGADLVVGVDSVRLRCIVVTYDPDTGVRDPEPLRVVHRQFEGRLALNCWTIEAGEIGIGDAVTVSPLTEATVRRTHPARSGWVSGAPYSLP